MAVHPEFQQNKWIYIYFTAQEGSKTINRIVRYSFDGSNFIKDRIILDDIPASANHNGGRLAFSPDGFLYVTTGDAEDAVLSQDVSSLAGKILRMRDDGSIPSDNPFGNAVWAFGFRNPQGLAWDSQGRLWATDHGRSGARSGLDELNLIEQGKNYGWPQIQGNQQKEGMQAPVLQSGNETWAPAGAVFLNGSVFFGGLRGEALYEAKITGNKIELKTHLKNEFGRIRAVVSGPDGSLYISTSNRDGRGAPKEGDDKIIKIDPKILN
jgi:glucose/arabinose dehydrogenase